MSMFTSYKKEISFWRAFSHLKSFSQLPPLHKHTFPIIYHNDINCENNNIPLPHNQVSTSLPRRHCLVESTHHCLNMHPLLVFNPTYVHNLSRNKKQHTAPNCSLKTVSIYNRAHAWNPVSAAPPIISLVHRFDFPNAKLYPSLRMSLLSLSAWNRYVIWCASIHFKYLVLEHIESTISIRLLLVRGYKIHL